MLSDIGHKIYNEIQGDKAIWLIFGLLAIISALAVYSATGSMAIQHGTNPVMYLLKHFVFILFGLGLTLICYHMHYMHYSNVAPMLLTLAAILLVYTMFFGIEINDARRWIKIPIIDLTFQTSDFAKIALIVYLARTISSKQEKIKDLNAVFLPLILPIILICGLIAPSDFSTAGLLFFTCLLMLFIGRVHMKFIGFLFMMGIILVAILIVLGTFIPDMVRVDTWISRMTEFFTSSEGGYQIQQAKIAIANGEWFGLGPGNSVQRNFLPYPYADFIYAIICEEYGMVGGFMMIFLYLSLIFRCTKIVTYSPKAFGAMLAIGLGLNIAIPAFANIAVSLDVVPVTGLTLPMISMGGTSLIFVSISFGIILSVSKYVERVQKHQMELEELENINESNN